MLEIDKYQQNVDKLQELINKIHFYELFLIFYYKYEKYIIDFHNSVDRFSKRKNQLDLYKFIINWYIKFKRNFKRRTKVLDGVEKFVLKIIGRIKY